MSMILKKKRTYVNPTMRIVQLEPTGNLMSVSNPEGSGEDIPWGRSRRLNDYWDFNYYDYEYLRDLHLYGCGLVRILCMLFRNGSTHKCGHNSRTTYIYCG